MALSIEPTTACNLRCPQCPSGLKQFTRATGNLKLPVNESILSQTGPFVSYINYYFQGEPFIHPQFTELVKAARKRKIYVVTSTNAHFISEETALKIVDSGLSELIISLDGLTQETYENYRVGGQLDQVLEGIKNITEARRKARSKGPYLVLQFLVTRYNEHEIEALQALAKAHGIDEVRLKTVQIYDFEQGHDLLPTNPKYRRYTQQADGKFTLTNKFKNQCWRMWSSCVFTWDGKVVPCCFDKDAQHQMGALAQTSFHTIWKSGIYADFRKKLMADRNQIEICRNCSEGSKIWV